KKISLGSPSSFYYDLTWSPDSKKIAYRDKHLTLFYLDIEKGTPVKVDTTPYYSPFVSFDHVWSHDSRWIAYVKELKSHLNAVCVYSLETGKCTQVTDGMSDARYPDFDKSGKYLFFTASTNTGLIPGWLNMVSMDRPVTRSVYVAVLRKDLPSPLAPESDEEKVKEPEKPTDKPADKKEGDKPAEKKDDKDKVKIDFDGISQRILALPIPSKNYSNLTCGKAGIV